MGASRIFFFTNERGIGGTDQCRGAGDGDKGKGKRGKKGSKKRVGGGGIYVMDA